MSNKKIITITLPPPTSCNRLWIPVIRNGHARLILTAEAITYKKMVLIMCRAAKIYKPLAGRIEIAIEYFPQRPLDWAKRAERNPDHWDDDVRALDVDNLSKLLFDSLKNIAFDDDKWVRKYSIERMQPIGKAQIVVTITQFKTESMQGSLLEDLA